MRAPVMTDHDVLREGNRRLLGLARAYGRVPRIRTYTYRLGDYCVRCHELGPCRSRRGHVRADHRVRRLARLEADRLEASRDLARLDRELDSLVLPRPSCVLGSGPVRIVTSMELWYVSVGAVAS